MIECLLCGWIGCQVCKNGSSYNHGIVKHDGISVFMDVSSSFAFYQTIRGKSVIGALYENNWGSKLESNFQWEEFELNQAKINKI
jgi:hypothetical protein